MVPDIELEGVTLMSFAEGTYCLVVVMSMMKPMAADIAWPPRVASIAVAATETRHLAAGAAALMAAAVSMADIEGVALIAVAAEEHRLTVVVAWMAADTAGPPWVASIAVAAAETCRLAAGVAALMAAAVSKADIEGMASIAVAAGHIV